jgi:hypothetical protein
LSQPSSIIRRHDRHGYLLAAHGPAVCRAAGNESSVLEHEGPRSQAGPFAATLLSGPHISQSDAAGGNSSQRVRGHWRRQAQQNLPAVQCGHIPFGSPHPCAISNCCIAIISIIYLTVNYMTGIMRGHTFQEHSGIVCIALYQRLYSSERSLFYETREGTLSTVSAQEAAWAELGKRFGTGAIMPQALAPISEAALAAADHIQATSRRRTTSTPVRKWFVRSFDGEKPPLAKVYSGGKSGTVAVKLYLALLWRSSSPPYTTDRAARGWATLLDLDDPDGLGSRRVRAALRSLSKANLVELETRPGQPLLVTVLDEGGEGVEYELPSTMFVKTSRGAESAEALRNPNLYFKIPSKLWTEGVMQTLSGPGLIMLLILLAEQADSKAVWFSTEEFPARYFISPSTRTKGTKELQQYGLLNTVSQPLPRPGGSVFDPRRRRYLYRLSGHAVIDAADATED